ncbi:MAG: hypothetical protein JEY91_17610 [Spirochaetaceae bacterium]|nr:hypothetical protein [Spirochaetaceae bacterium]
MTKLRFFINMAIVILFLILGIILTGNSLTLYVDSASLILGIIIPYIIVSFVFTPRDQMKFKKEIFTPEGTGDKAELAKALIYFKSFKNLLIASSVTVTILGFIGIMANLEDRSSIGPNLAVMMIVPFYVAIFLLIVVEPLRAAAEKNLKG